MYSKVIVSEDEDESILNYLLHLNIISKSGGGRFVEASRGFWSGPLPVLVHSGWSACHEHLR